MAFQKGQSGNPDGRPKGAKDKLPRSVKDKFDYLYDEVGGNEGFKKWIMKNDHNRGVFYGWYSKMLPSNVTADVKGTIDGLFTVEVIHLKGADVPEDGNGNGNGNEVTK